MHRTARDGRLQLQQERVSKTVQSPFVVAASAMPCVQCYLLYGLDPVPSSCPRRAGALARPTSRQRHFLVTITACIELIVPFQGIARWHDNASRIVDAFLVAIGFVV